MGGGEKKKRVGWRKKRYLCIDFIVSVPSQMRLTSLPLLGIFIAEGLSQGPPLCRGVAGAA